MATEIDAKLNRLFSGWSEGAIYLNSYLKKRGIYDQLLSQYRKSKWVKSVGSGAVARYNDKISIVSGVSALQAQAYMPIHFGGKTALSMLGRSHYLELDMQKVTIFGKKNRKLPAWFKNYSWEAEWEYHTTDFLPYDLGLTEVMEVMEVKVDNFTIKISSAARAMLECLYLAPDKQDLVECYQIMESLNNLRPDSVQELLEECSSVKVKRLFVYMADKAEHSWLKYLELDKIDLGSGKRSIVKNGVYVKKYMITIPRELENNDEPNI